MKRPFSLTPLSQGRQLLVAGIMALACVLGSQALLDAAITHASTTRDNLCTQVKTDCGSSFKIKIEDSGSTVLWTGTATWGSVSSGSMSVSSVAATIGTTGTASKFVVTTSADVTVFSGTVTATGGGGDVTSPTVSFVSGATFTLSTFSYTAPS